MPKLQYINIIKQQYKQKNFLFFPRLSYKMIGLFFSHLIRYPLIWPLDATLIVTYRCNLKCLKCALYERSEVKNELSLNEYSSLLEDMKKIGLEAIGITGGEPLLREDITLIINKIKMLKMIGVLNTNGTLIDRKMASNLLKTQLEHINISLDGLEETHNYLRGSADSFCKTIRGLENLLAEKMRIPNDTKICIVSVLNQHNLKDVPGLVDLTKRLKLTIGFMPEFPSGRPVNENKIIKETIEYLIKEKLKNNALIDNSIRFLKYMERWMSNDIRRPLRCYAGYSTLNLDCYGNIFACVPHFISNREPELIINGRGLSRIIKSREFKNLQRETTVCRGCCWNCHTELNLLYSIQV